MTGTEARGGGIDDGGRIVTCGGCGSLNRLDAALVRAVDSGEMHARCDACGVRLAIAQPRAAEAAPSRAAPPARRRGGMRLLGWILVLAGALGLVVSFSLDTTVATLNATDVVYGMTRVPSAELLARQIVAAIASAAVLLSGAVFIAAAHVADADEKV